jgi:hypothetical protein
MNQPFIVNLTTEKGLNKLIFTDVIEPNNVEIRDPMNLEMFETYNVTNTGTLDDDINICTIETYIPNNTTQAYIWFYSEGGAVGGLSSNTVLFSTTIFLVIILASVGLLYLVSYRRRRRD